MTHDFERSGAFDGRQTSVERNRQALCPCPSQAGPFIWLEKILAAIPDVKPVITGCGMYLRSVSMRSEPAAISIILASNVHRIRAPYPNLAMTLNTTGMNAAVGPPICTREPPSPRMTTPGFIFSQTATQGSSQEVRTEPDSARRVRPHLRCAAEAARR